MINLMNSIPTSQMKCARLVRLPFQQKLECFINFFTKGSLYFSTQTKAYRHVILVLYANMNMSKYVSKYYVNLEPVFGNVSTNTICAHIRFNNYVHIITHPCISSIALPNLLWQYLRCENIFA